MHDAFRKFAHKTSEVAGSPWAFALAFAAIILWGVTGPIFHFSESWQLLVNTGTTILTFLMVFLIQNTQNRDSHAVHLKLDELIKAVDTARNALIDVEDGSDEVLEKLEQEFDQMRKDSDAASA